MGFELANDWQLAAFGLGLAGVLIGCCWLHEQGRIPFDRLPESSVTTALGPIAALALLTIMGIQLAARGDAARLPHIPLMNPIDLAVWLLALSIWNWWKRINSVMGDALARPARRLMALAGLAAAFASLNGLLTRAVHQWADVPFLPDALWGSSAMQVTLSIAWTLVEMVGMLISRRRGRRGAWMGFAALLAVVVFKLFTVDLSQLSTLTRIGTFLAVGALLLVLGYVSPVPPSKITIERGSADPVSLGDSS